MSADDLYETDFVAWTERQAAALRALPPESNALDPTYLAEEIEDLGRAERRACESYVLHILEHLIKLASGASEPAQGWRVEIDASRRRLAKRATPSIRARFDMDAAWVEAVAAASVALSAYGDRPPRLSTTAPFAFGDLVADGPSIEELIGRIDAAMLKGGAL